MISVNEANKIPVNTVSTITDYFTAVENKIKSVMRLGETKKFSLIDINYGTLVYPDVIILHLISKELEDNDYIVENKTNSTQSKSNFIVSW